MAKVINQTKDLLNASEEIQSYLRENDLEFISLKHAQKIVTKKNINVTLNKYLQSLKEKEKTKISGAVNPYMNKWLIYNDINITKDDIDLSSYEMLADFIWQRISKSLKSFAFMGYFIVITIGVGIIGAFLGSLNYLGEDFDPSSFNISLIGYSVVLSCSATIEFLFISFNKEKEKRHEVCTTSIKMFGFTSFILITILSLLSYLIENVSVKTVITVILTLFAIATWWIANAQSGKFIDEENLTKPSEAQSSGGDVNQKLTGSIPNDFKV